MLVKQNIFNITNGLAVAIMWSCIPHCTFCAVAIYSDSSTMSVLPAFYNVT